MSQVVCVDVVSKVVTLMVTSMDLVPLLVVTFVSRQVVSPYRLVLQVSSVPTTIISYSSSLSPLIHGITSFGVLTSITTLGSSPLSILGVASSSVHVSVGIRGSMISMAKVKNLWRRLLSLLLRLALDYPHHEGFLFELQGHWEPCYSTYFASVL